MDRRALSIAVTLGLVTACSARSGGSVSAPPDLAPALGAVCDLIARCPDFPPLASRSRAECIDIAYWAITCRVSSTGTERLELPLDAASSEACATFLAGLPCDELSCVSEGTCPEGAACAALFGGFGDAGGEDVVGEGERCYRYGSPGCDDAHFCAPEAYDEEHGVMLCEVCAPRLSSGATCDPYAPRPECQPGLVCVRAMDGTGACGPARADGQPCSAASECVNGFCANGTCLGGGHAGDPCVENDECRYEERLSCIAGTCALRLAGGAACDDDYDCLALRCHTDGLCGIPDLASCPDSSYCRTGYCDSVCRPRIANGTACSFDDACASGHCDEASSLCAPAPPPQPVGGACNDASDCETGLSCDVTCYVPCSDACPPGLFCMYTGRRTECLPPMPNGSGCDDDENCESGWCNDDVCATRPGLGDACTGYLDCGPSAYCSGGVCAARRGPDEACEGYDSCLAPFFCNAGRCTLISLACEPAPVGQQCTYLRFCAPDAYCDLSTFTCVARPGLGEECSSGFFENCAPGLHCTSSETGSTCQPRVAEGGACTPESACVEGTFCIGGTCRAGEGGQECHGSDGCPLGTFCNDRTDTCEPFRQLGDECDPGDVDCDATLYCDRSSFPGVCRARPVLGEDCDRDSWCGAGATCSNTSSGMCIARVGLGAECADSFDDPYGSNCDEALYCDHDESPYVCASRLALGATCDYSSECLSRFCLSNRCVASAECVLPSAL